MVRREVGCGHDFSSPFLDSVSLGSVVGGAWVPGAMQCIYTGPVSLSTKKKHICDISGASFRRHFIWPGVPGRGWPVRRGWCAMGGVIPGSRVCEFLFWQQSGTGMPGHLRFAPVTATPYSCRRSQEAFPHTAGRGGGVEWVVDMGAVWG